MATKTISTTWSKNYGIMHVRGDILQKWIPFLGREVKITHNGRAIIWDNYNPDKIWNHILYKLEM